MTVLSRQSIIVTRSWDDGHCLNLCLAELLVEHHLPGTFNIAPASVALAPADRLPRSAIAIISEQFEIGVRTVTYPRLTDLSETFARQDGAIADMNEDVR
jgi:hypothetical protein